MQRGNVHEMGKNLHAWLGAFNDSQNPPKPSPNTLETQRLVKSLSITCRRGTVQAMGENLYALMGALSAAPQLNDPTTDLPKHKAVYWDFLGIFQVSQTMLLTQVASDLLPAAGQTNSS